MTIILYRIVEIVSIDDFVALIELLLQAIFAFIAFICLCVTGVRIVHK